MFDQLIESIEILKETVKKTVNWNPVVKQFTQIKNQIIYPIKIL